MTYLRRSKMRGLKMTRKSYRFRLSPKQYENIQEEVKSRKEQCRIQFGFKRSRRFLVLLLLSTTFCVMSNFETKHSLQKFPTNLSVQVRPTSNMFELKAPQKTGVRSILKDLFPLRDDLGVGSFFVRVECC